MGKIYGAGDLPNHRFIINSEIASVASNGADTLNQALGVMPYVGDLKEAYFIASASQAGATNHYRIMKLINNGTGGTGTTVMGTLALLANIAKNKPSAFTLAAGSAATAAGGLTYVTVSAGNGVAVVAGKIQLQFE